jgi:hypothetical protein
MILLTETDCTLKTGTKDMKKRWASIPWDLIVALQELEQKHNI